MIKMNAYVNGVGHSWFEDLRRRAQKENFYGRVEKSSHWIPLDNFIEKSFSHGSRNFYFQIVESLNVSHQFAKWIFKMVNSIELEENIGQSIVNS